MIKFIWDRNLNKQMYCDFWGSESTLIPSGICADSYESAMCDLRFFLSWDLVCENKLLELAGMDTFEVWKNWVWIRYSFFCGMLVDGSMNMYTQELHTVISIHDERLSKEGRNQSEKRWIESILNFIL